MAGLSLIKGGLPAVARMGGLVAAKTRLRFNICVGSWC
jgi:hypothetical protein